MDPNIEFDLAQESLSLSNTHISIIFFRKFNAGDYWIPPPEPTLSPTAPCPECEMCPNTPTTSQPSKTALLLAGLGGATFVLIVGLIRNFFHRKNKKSDYSIIPN